MKKKFVIPLLALCIHPVVTTIFDYLLAIYILQDMDALIVSSHYLFFLLALFGSIPNFLLFNVIFLIIISQSSHRIFAYCKKTDSQVYYFHLKKQGDLH